MEQENTPIIVSNTHWDLPDNLIKDVQAERMINGLIGLTAHLSPEECVGFAEIVAYLMPASQEAVLRADVTKIYLYCVTQLQKRKGLYDALPKECRVDELTNYEMQKLNELKKWIYKQRGGKEKNPLINALREVFFEKKPNQETQFPRTSETNNEIKNPSDKEIGR